MGELARNLYRAEIMKNDGGTVMCKNCGNVTGYIYPYNHKHIKYMFLCKCTGYGKVEISRGKKPKLLYPQRKVYQKENIHICPNCERELFRVEEESVLNYSFNVVCKCGVEYDVKYFVKKLG